MLFPALYNAGEPTGHVHKAAGAAHCHKVVVNVADGFLSSRCVCSDEQNMEHRLAEQRWGQSQPLMHHLEESPTAIGCWCVCLEIAHSVEDASYYVCGRIDFSNEGHPRRKRGTFEQKLQPLISKVADVGGFWTLEALSRTISLRTQLKTEEV